MVDGRAAVEIGRAVTGDPISSRTGPEILVSRLRHYFLTRKLILEDEPPPLSVAATIDHEHALAVVQAAMDDYDEAYG